MIFAIGFIFLISQIVLLLIGRRYLKKTNEQHDYFLETQKEFNEYLEFKKEYENILK